MNTEIFNQSGGKFVDDIKDNDIKSVGILIGRFPHLVNEVLNDDSKQKIKPLHLASKKGHIEIVKLLIDNGAELEARMTDGTTPLHLASLHNQLPVVELLLAKGVNINVEKESGRTPLYSACEKNNVEIVNALLKKGANPNIIRHIPQKYNDSPLRLAIRNCNLDIIKLLIQYGATEVDNHYSGFINCDENVGKYLIDKFNFSKLLLDTNLYKNINKFKIVLENNPNVHILDDVNSNTALHVACISNNTEAVQLLLERDVNANLSNKDGNTPLLIACSHGNLDIVKLLLKRAVTVNLSNKVGSTPLQIACLKGNLEIVKLLLESKADVNVLDKDGKSPLLFACYSGNLEIVKLLLEYKADVNVSNKDGITPLIYACSKDNLKMVKLLLEYKADVNVPNKEGITPLIYACSKNNLEIVKLLLEFKADVNFQNKDSIAPLLLACSKDNLEIIKLLLEFKADVNVKSKEGNTPLLIACSKDNLEIVKLLLEFKADVNVRNQYGSTPLLSAFWVGNPEIIILLLKYKADINVRDNDGFTPLYIATYKKESIVLIKLLLEYGANINECSLNYKKTVPTIINNLEIFNLLINNPNFFIDQFSKYGENLLMNAIEIGNFDYIQKLLDKDININAVDKDGDTALHYALRKKDETIIALLCSHPKIVPFIPNRYGRTAIDLSKETKYALIVKNSSGISLEDALSQKWKGVTKEHLEYLFDSIYLDKAHSDDNIFRSKNDLTPCPACLIPVERKGGCYHIQHMCLEDFSKDIYTGGIVPYWNNLLRTIPDHGFEMQTKNICHMCSICGTTYGGMTDRPPMEYPIRFKPGTEAKIIHDYFVCPYGFQLKYYRIYKIIQKIQEIQPRDGTVSPFTYAQAMQQITLAGANVIFNQIPAGDLNRVITDIKTRKTFLPVDTSMFPNIDMKVLYPPLGKIKRIPNMRKMNDVLDYELMPQIITYPELKNADGTSKDPKEYASPLDPVDFDTHENFIKFRHREFTIDNRYQIKEHQNISLESFMNSFNSTISQIDQENFGKCVLFPFEIQDGKCKSYLYPEELGILINKGHIDHATYIKYRDSFHNSDLIQIEHSADAEKYFIPDTVARAGGSIKKSNILDNKFKAKYLKYKQKYIQLKTEFAFAHSK